MSSSEGKPSNINSKNNTNNNMLFISCIDSSSGASVDLEIERDEVVESLMALYEVMGGVPLEEQEMSFNGKTLPINGVLADVLKPLPEPATTSATSRIAIQVQRKSTTVSAPPVPVPTVSGNDAASRIRDLFSKAKAVGTSTPSPATGNTTAPNNEHVALPEDEHGDVDDIVETQRKLLEYIRQKNVQENLENALEHTPEAFASVCMLYVPCKFNGEKVSAFVDSGAQISIMSAATAERCGLSHLIDTRYRGKLVGVGSQDSVGRIYMATVQLEDTFLPLSLTILQDSTIDFILGLDQMRRHRMVIDLDKNCLRFQEKELQFLPEHEIPRRAEENPTQTGNTETKTNTNTNLTSTSTATPSTKTSSVTTNTGGARTTVTTTTTATPQPTGTLTTGSSSAIPPPPPPTTTTTGTTTTITTADPSAPPQEEKERKVSNTATISTDERRAAVEYVTQVTLVDESVALILLEATNFDVDSALELFYSSNGME